MPTLSLFTTHTLTIVSSKGGSTQPTTTNAFATLVPGAEIMAKKGAKIIANAEAAHGESFDGIAWVGTLSIMVSTGANYSAETAGCCRGQGEMEINLVATAT
jgi:hypothetical protein